jgi:MoaA/NifB/PqqE/SkfB family radical SAM enzyme
MRLQWAGVVFRLRLAETGIPERPSVEGAGARLPVALLSLHSHRDRSFLDDVRLHELSGALAAHGLPNDLLVAYVPREPDADGGAALRSLIDALSRYPTVVYERVWHIDIVARLREALPDATLIRLEGEHAFPGAPADHVVPHRTRDVAALLDRLTGHDAAPWEGRPYEPNLHPVYASPESRPAFRSYPIIGNHGCPYGADARDNPLYAGVDLPEGRGRGCAFCVTGNDYQARPAQETLASTLSQLRMLRARAPEIDHLVLRDQSPFHYLTELVEAADRERLGPFTLLFESRADWFLQNEKRFSRALQAAASSEIVLAPFLVGIENFSQAELDRFNKGIDAATNVAFLQKLRAWRNAFPRALDLGQAAFGFILFTPWTTIADLEVNLSGIRKSRLHELRGHLLLSRARLYEDTALYHLAKRDGLLTEAYGSPDDDASARYGYLPSTPYRFADSRVAKIAELANVLVPRLGGRDEVELMAALLEAVGGAADPEVVTPAQVAELLARRTGMASKGERGTQRPQVRELRLSVDAGDVLELRFTHRGARSRPARTEDLLHRLDAHASPYLQRVVLEGGNPMRHVGFADLVARVQAIGATDIAVSLEGTALTDEALDQLSDVGVTTLMVVLGGIRAPVHDAVMHAPGSLRPSLEGLSRAVQRAGLRVHLVVPLLAANEKDLVPLLEWTEFLPGKIDGFFLALPPPELLSPLARRALLPPAAAARAAERLFDACSRRRIDYGFTSRRGVSPCGSGGSLDRYAAIFHDRVRFVEHEPEDTLVRIPACAECALFSTCKGMERAEVGMHGAEAFAPVSLDRALGWKLRPLNELEQPDYKHVSPFENVEHGDTRSLLRVNGHCNMACAFCFVDRTAPDFDSDELARTVGELAARSTDHLVLSGGEPTLHPGLVDLVRRARDLGFRTIEIQTNGVRAADPAYVQELVGAGLNKVTVSLHSHDASKSDRITKLPGAFGKTVAAIRNFRIAGAETQIAHVIDRENYRDLPEFVRFLRRELPDKDAHLSMCLAIAQPISDLVLRWVIPTFSEIKPYVREALDFCLENDFGFGGMIGQGGYPPCMLDGDLRYYAHVLDEVHRSDDADAQFYKAERCDECSFNPYCVGVRRAYVAQYGDGEIRPFTAAVPSGARRLEPTRQRLVPAASLVRRGP